MRLLNRHFDSTKSIATATESAGIYDNHLRFDDYGKSFRRGSRYTDRRSYPQIFLRTLRISPSPQKTRRKTMCWQDRFLESMGPGLLPGITISKWFATLRKANFRISAQQIPRAIFISGASVLNSIGARVEKLIFQRKILRQKIERPVFILGCWRSGTTYLQNLLSNDEQFGFPNLYQTLFPSHFLYTEGILKRLFDKLVPETRPQDNVRLSMNLPSEEEIALCALSGASHLIGDTMTMSATSRYEKYITLDGLTPQEKQAWKNGYEYFVKKLALRHQKPLLLKSPAHTGRINALLELFPDAKFITVHRHPYAVFRSGISWLKNTRRFWGLQQSSHDDTAEIFLRNYRLVMNSYFKERQAIPQGNLVEIRFDHLEQDPVMEIESAYDSLGMDGFGGARLAFERHTRSNKNYNKNKREELASLLKDQIYQACPQVFDEWCYETSGPSTDEVAPKPRLSKFAA